jgi:hypothetical protein
MLRLPAELRIIIYEYTFVNETVHVQPKSSDQYLYLLRLRGGQKHQPAISLLMTCNLIRREARPIFNDRVTFDLTPYYNCMAAVYELGPDVCQFIKAIQIEPRLAKRIATGLQLGFPPVEGYRHLLPSLQRVYIKHSPLFGLLVVSHDLAIRAVRLYFGNDDLEVRFVE